MLFIMSKRIFLKNYTFFKNKTFPTYISAKIGAEKLEQRKNCVSLSACVCMCDIEESIGRSQNEKDFLRDEMLL